MKLYEEKEGRLIEIASRPTADFWDKQWIKKDLREQVLAGKRSWLVGKITRKFLPEGGKVLDAGCGNGGQVYGFNSWGFDGYGVDFAVETIKETKKIFPELKVSCQDVRKLDFESKEFDGYWSLGVIEHFWEGYGQIIDEAWRVLKPGGVLMVTFPAMNPLRRLKARLGLYPKFEGRDEPREFYQFNLNERTAIREIEKRGFKIVYKQRIDGVKGLKDEVKWFKKPLQLIYGRRSGWARMIRYAISAVTRGWAGHGFLAVFKKI